MNFRGFAFTLRTFSGSSILRRAVDSGRATYGNLAWKSPESTREKFSHRVRRLRLHGGGHVGAGVQGEPCGAVTVKVAFAPLPEDAEKPCGGGADCPSRAFTDLGGCGNGLFGPSNNLTRAQPAQILYNREGRSAVAGNSPFTDTVNGTWYADAVNHAAENGIVRGGSGGTFGPDGNIAREQLAAILRHCSKSPAATSKELHFNGADEISGYAPDAVRWAVDHRIPNGFGDGRLDPKGLAARSQAAQMLKNFIENQEKNT